MTRSCSSRPGRDQRRQRRLPAQAGRVRAVHLGRAVGHRQPGYAVTEHEGRVVRRRHMAAGASLASTSDELSAKEAPPSARAWAARQIGARLDTGCHDLVEALDQRGPSVQEIAAPWRRSNSVPSTSRHDLRDRLLVVLAAAASRSDPSRTPERRASTLRRSMLGWLPARLESEQAVDGRTPSCRALGAPRAGSPAPALRAVALAGTAPRAGVADEMVVQDRFLGREVSKVVRRPTPAAAAI